MINVFNIERFATHDGDGIRTVIFLKGCPLHCPWCANPESWKKEHQIQYFKNKCVLCKKCSRVCPTGAISFKDNLFYYDESKCQKCFRCVEYCPTGAIEKVGQNMKIDDVVDIVMKDWDYYENSNGGVTISGGEPFYQFDAFKELLIKCKNKNLNIAVETTGNYSLEKLIKVEKYIDIFLFDIKHLDVDVLKKVTGADYDYVMKNFNYLVEKCPNKVVIRVPVIPEFNYTDEYLKQVIRLAKDKNVREINLLPYHTLGKNKWDRMLKKYYSDMKMMDKNELIPYKEYGEKIGVKIKIGG